MTDTAAATAIPEDIQALSFEDAMTQLEEIVQKLEGGRVSLDDSIALYTRGDHLRRHCSTRLRDAESRVEKLIAGEGGVTGTTPLEMG